MLIIYKDLMLNANEIAAIFPTRTESRERKEYGYMVQITLKNKESVYTPYTFEEMRDVIKICLRWNEYTEILEKDVKKGG